MEDNTEPIYAFYPLLANSQYIKDALLEEFGEKTANVIIKKMRAGEDFSKSEERAYAIIAYVVSEYSTEADVLYGRGYAGPFPIAVMEFESVYWIDAQEFDLVGYYRNFEDALAHAESNWAPFIEALEEEGSDGTEQPM